MSLITILRKTKGTLAKQQILKSANANDKKIFQYAYDPDKTFGLSFDHIRDYTIADCGLDKMFEILDRLASRELTGNAAREEVHNFAVQCGDLIKLICNKDLDCGISYGNLDRAFGKDFVNKFAVQLAKEVPLKDLKYPLWAQIKYDGVRVVAIRENGNVTFKTRNGKTFACPVIESAIKAIDYPGDFVIDGEFVAAGGLSVGRTNISGRVNSAIHGGVLAGTDITFAAFDFLLLESFRKQMSLLSYRQRHEQLILVLAPNLSERLIVAEVRAVNSPEEANVYFEKVLAQGFEGLILKSPQSLYTFKRSKDWIKVKAILDADLLCSDIQDGTGKYEGFIGALECCGLVEGKNVKVMVGSGLSDCQRGFPHEYFLGKKIAVQYNAVIQDSKTGQWSLFLPRFIAVRGDL